MPSRPSPSLSALVCLSLASSLLAACTGDGTMAPPGPVSDSAPGYLQIHERYLAPTCTSSACHDGDRGIAGLSFSDPRASYLSLIDTPPTNGGAERDGLARVRPGDLDGSLLWWKLSAGSDMLTAHGYGAPMPLGGSNAPGPMTLAAVEQWIAAGAPWDGLDFEADFRDDAGAYVDCDATDEAGMRACFGDNPDPDRYLRLFTPILEIPPNSDIQICSYLDVATDEELLFRATRGKQMRGGHHIAVFHATTRREDDVPHECTDEEMVSLQFAAGAGGAGGQDTDMPEGVALRIGPARQIVLQSHYINTTDEPLRIMDMVDVERTTPAETDTVVDSFAVIDSDFEVPVRARGYERVKTCRIDQPMDIYLLLGHTHDYGTLFTFEHVPADGSDPVELYRATDGPLLRDNPEILMWDEPLHLAAGDAVRMTCVWDNTTDRPLGWPEEMCVALMYYGPGRGWLTCDTDDETPKGHDATAPACLGPTEVTGNEIGVGKYCTIGGTECADNGDASFCLNEHSEWHNYCTVILCDTDADCGTGASCIEDGPGSACLLDRCES